MRILHVGFGFRPLRWGGLIAYVEDLMDGQIARGHEVGYFFAGRAYPFMTAPRLKRWGRGGVAMFEVINSPIIEGGGHGTAFPRGELNNKATEVMFGRVLRGYRPDVIHVQELLALPTSLLDVARAHSVPVVMSLHDYGAICPTLHLFDHKGQICNNPKPGEDCTICCRDAPLTQRYQRERTMFYEETRLLEATKLKHIPRPRPLVSAFRRASRKVQIGHRRALEVEEPQSIEGARPGAAARDYDFRLAVNVDRLSQVDLLLAVSTRVAEIYRLRGVAAKQLRIMHITLKHISQLRPCRITLSGGPVRFVTLAGASSPGKGSDVLLRALEILRDEGLGPGDFRLSVRGAVEERMKPILPQLPGVTLDGVYGPGQMDALLEQHHVAIFPSILQESYGFVGVECIAKGVPVIANRLGGVTDYVLDGETGWLTAAPTGEELARIMLRLIRDPQQIEAANQSTLESRDNIVIPVDLHVRELESVYAGVIAGRVPEQSELR